MIKQLLFFALLSVCYAMRLLKDLDFENDTLNLSAHDQIKLPTLEPQPRINIYEIEI